MKMFTVILICIFVSFCIFISNLHYINLRIVVLLLQLSYSGNLNRVEHAIFEFLFIKVSLQ